VPVSWYGSASGENTIAAVQFGSEPRCCVGVYGPRTSIDDDSIDRTGSILGDLAQQHIAKHGFWIALAGRTISSAAGRLNTDDLPRLCAESHL
jgi:hypothetical protein